MSNLRPSEPTASSPYATGGGGVDLETDVVVYYLAAALTRSIPRGLPDAIAHTVSVQAAGRGEPLDDLVVFGTRSDGEAKLSLQVKRTLSFSEGDSEFADVVWRTWQTISSTDFQIGVDAAGIAIGVYQRAVDEHYQRVLSWARSAVAGAEFVDRIEALGISHERQRFFVRTIRELLTRGLGRNAVDDEVWRFCRAFVIVYFDVQNEGSQSAALTEALLRSRLEDAHRAVDLRNELHEEAKRLKHSSGTATTGSLRTRISGRFNIRDTDSRQHRRFLEALRTASRSASADASVVDIDRNVRLEDGLYVQRDVEPKLLEALETGQTAVLLVGEAGQGKTTLLWHLWWTFSQSSTHEPWLIKPTRLFSGSSALSIDTFEGAIQAARDEGRTPVALFDTVDVLLHDEDTIDGIRDLLTELHRAHCVVVASTRPAEATILRRIGLRFFEQLLGNYNEHTGEMERAITAHVRSFYGDYDPSRHGEYVKNIVNAVAAGLPLRQVSLNPLTLRMLFVLYAPKAIPPDINVVELFREYWRRRVETDTRPGFTAPHDTYDLARAAEAIALTMLIEGKPEIDTDAAHSVLARLSIDPTDITALVRRGIVHRSASKISFFHQTFFEHAAARMLLRQNGAACVLALLERVRSRGHDPFLGPVLEQALLLAPSDPLLREAADEILVKLLDSDEIGELKTALTVFAMRDSIPNAATQRVRALIRNSRQEAAIIGLFSSAANAPARRSGDLLDLVALAWESDTSWRIRQKTFVLLERLSGRFGTAVRACLERIGAIGYALTESVKLQPESELRDVLRALAPSEPAWTWNAIVQLYTAAGDRSDGLRVKMLRLLADRAAEFGRTAIASDFEQLVEISEPDVKRDDRSDFHEAWARLWTIEWSFAKPIQEILDGIPSTSERARGRYVALRDRMVSGASVDDIRFVWQRMMADTDAARQALAMMTLWAPFLAGKAPAELCAEVRNRFREAVSAVPKEGQTLLFNAISHSQPSTKTILEVFSGAEFDAAEPWLDVRRLASVTGAAYLAGHKGAAKAITTVAANSQDYGKTAELLLPTLGGVELTGDAASLFVTLAVAAGVKKTITSVQRLSDSSLAALAKEAEFGAALAAWRVSRSGNTRKEATRLLSLLVDRGAIPPPPFDELATQLDTEQDPAHAGHIAMLIGQGAKRGFYDIGKVLTRLKPYALGGEEVRTNALTGIITAVINNTAADEHLDSVFDLIMEPPTDQGRLKHAHDLLLRLVEIDPRRAVERFRGLIASDTARSLGPNAKRDLRSALETPGRAIISAATKQERIALVREIPTLDRYLAPVVIKPLCQIAYGEIGSLLDEVASRADPDVFLIIRQAAKNQQRVFGSARWTDVWRLVLSA